MQLNFRKEKKKTPNQKMGRRPKQIFLQRRHTDGHQIYKKMLSGKALSCQCRRCRFNPWVGKIPWSRKWQSPPVFSPGESHGHMSQADYSPWGPKESDKTEHISRHKLFRATICPGGCISACFSNTSNFFCYTCLLRMTIFYHLQG